MHPGPYLDLLRRNGAFRSLYIAQLISFAGDWFGTVALLGLALELTGSTGVASLVLVLQTGPFFIVSPLAGILADRLDRKHILVASNAARAVIALGFLLARDADTLWIALVCVALLSTGAAFFEPTSSAALPNLVDEADLPTANALIGAAWGTMLAVGAGLGGLVATLAGRDASFVANAVGFAVSAVLIARVSASFRAPPQESPPVQVPARGAVVILDPIRVTAALVGRSRMVGALLLTKATFGVGMGAVLLLAVFGRDVFGAGDAGIGLLFAARGVGALVGPFLGRRFMTGDDRSLLVVIAIAMGSFVLGYGLLPASPTIALGAACVFLAHLGGGAQWSLSSYGLQRLVPDEIRGRVFSIDYALVLLATTVSTIVAGQLVGPLGPGATLYVLVGAAGISGLVWFAWTRPLRRPTHEEAPPVPTGGA
ncbi:MAG: MFS transporter [Chloroflexi bacterium]|nr:MFS transporter [Chloroflexota bacterium]